jgi:hypothetical protein
VSPSALLTLQKKTRGLLSSPYAKLLWIGVAMAGGIALRSAKLPEFMLPIIVGIIVAASVVLVLRLTGAGDQAFAPNQPDSRPQPRPSGSVPQPAACKDPTSRLDQFADRASAQRRKKSL